MNVDLVKAIATVRDLGVFGLLVIAIIGGFQGWYVWSWYYKELKQANAELRASNERWIDIALGALRHAEQSHVDPRA